MPPSLTKSLGFLIFCKWFYSTISHSHCDVVHLLIPSSQIQEFHRGLEMWQTQTKLRISFMCTHTVPWELSAVLLHKRSVSWNYLRVQDSAPSISLGVKRGIPWSQHQMTLPLCEQVSHLLFSGLFSPLGNEGDPSLTKPTFIMCLLSGEVVLFDQDHNSTNGMKERHVRKIIWRSLGSWMSMSVLPLWRKWIRHIFIPLKAEGAVKESPMLKDSQQMLW